MWLDDFVSRTYLNWTPETLKSLFSRGVSKDQVTLFRLGYLNGELPYGVDYPPHFLSWVRNQKGVLEDTFVLPLTNVSGDVLGIQFRHRDKARKGYLTWTLETGEPILFGLGVSAPAMFESEQVVVVEGAFDFFPIHRHVPFTLVTQTARISDNIAKLLKRLVKVVWFGYDTDSTGKAARRRAMSDHPEFEYREVSFPALRMSSGKYAKDPGEVWEVWGDAKLKAHLTLQGL